MNRVPRTRTARSAAVLGAAGAALLLAGCAATNYQLQLMPRTSGKIYTGDAVLPPNGTEANVNITIEDKLYTGTWVQTAADRATGYVSGGFGWGGWGWRRSGVGIGTTVSVDNPEGGEAKALLRSADGAGLRCDLRGLGAARSGGGTCQDDKGVVYDVQIRVKEKQ